MIPNKENNAAYKKKKGQAISAQPSVELRTNGIRPHFKAFEHIKIRLFAKCENISAPEDRIEYRWYYSDSEGDEKSCITKDSMAMLSCPDFFCGRVIKLTVKVHKVFSFTDNTPKKWLEKPSFSISEIAEAEDSIILYPNCDMEMADEVLWFPDTTEMNHQVHVELNIFGYNYKEIRVFRCIEDGNKRLFYSGNTVTVYNNAVTLTFNRADCAINTTEEKTLKFSFQIIDANNGKYLGEGKKYLTVNARNPVKPLSNYLPQPVVSGNVYIVENNYRSCKYTQIDIEYTKDANGKEKSKLTVFEEGLIIKNDKVYIIGGKRKATVTLMEYTTETCFTSEDGHNKKKAMLLYANQSAQELSIVVSKEKTGTIENMEFSYQYDINIAKFLWLPFNRIQTNKLMISTCRYSHNIDISMLPDIKWEVYMKISNKNSLAYIYTQMPKEYGIFESHQEKAIAAGKNESFSIDNIDISFGLTAEYDDTKKIDITSNFSSGIKTVVETLFAIKKGLDKLSFKEDVEANRKKIEARNIAPKSSKIPIFIDISKPSFLLGGGWQYDVSRYNKPARKGEIVVAASPLIKAKGGIDLIACSTYIPVAGQIIQAILGINDLAKWLTDKISRGKVEYDGDIWFNLYLSGKISIKGVFEFSKEEKEVKLEIPTTIVLGVELGLKSEITVKTVSIKGETTRTVKAGVSGEAKTSIGVVGNLGYNSNSNDGMFLGLKVTFGGLIITISGEAKYEEKKGKDKNKQSKGLDFGKDFILIHPCDIWKGELYPFKKNIQ